MAKKKGEFRLEFAPNAASTAAPRACRRFCLSGARSRPQHGARTPVPARPGPVFGVSSGPDGGPGPTPTARRRNLSGKPGVPRPRYPVSRPCFRPALRPSLPRGGRRPAPALGPVPGRGRFGPGRRTPSSSAPAADALL